MIIRFSQLVLPFQDPIPADTTDPNFSYDKGGNIIKAYNFIGAFPVDLSPIDLDWGSNDAIEEFSVTLAYQWWETDTTS